jgi:hypothetical protein
MDFDLGMLLTLAIRWLSSGTTGIITGIFGLGGVAAAIFYVLKKVREAKFKNNLDRVSSITGSESSRLAHSSRATTSAIDAMMDGEVERQRANLKPEIIAPKKVRAGETFVAQFLYMPTGLRIYADKNWDLKLVTAEKVRIVLMGAGVRTIDVKIGDLWCSATVIVEKET